MTVQRGDVWLANLNPTRGSEQAGIRPVLVFQNDAISCFTTTVLAISLTTTLRRQSLERCDDLPPWKALQTVSGCHTSLSGILGEA